MVNHSYIGVCHDEIMDTLSRQMKAVAQNVSPPIIHDLYLISTMFQLLYIWTNDLRFCSTITEIYVD